MTENELIRALAEYAATESLTPLAGSSERVQEPPKDSPAPGVSQFAARILQRDQRRVKTLAALCLVLWLVAAGGLSFLGYAVSECWGSYLRIRLYERPLAPADKMRADRMRAIYHRHIDDIVEYTIYALIVTPIAIGLASVVTLALVFSSRGATLRQVNANLIAISVQLKSLHRTPAGPAIRSD